MPIHPSAQNIITEVYPYSISSVEYTVDLNQIFPQNDEILQSLESHIITNQKIVPQTNQTF